MSYSAIHARYKIRSDRDITHSTLFLHYQLSNHHGKIRRLESSRKYIHRRNYPRIGVSKYILMEKLTKKIIEEKCENLKRALLATLDIDEQEENIKLLKIKTHNELLLARDEVRQLKTL